MRLEFEPYQEIKPLIPWFTCSGLDEGTSRIDVGGCESEEVSRLLDYLGVFEYRAGGVLLCVHVCMCVCVCVCTCVCACVCVYASVSVHVHVHARNTMCSYTHATACTHGMCTRTHTHISGRSRVCKKGDPMRRGKPVVSIACNFGFYSRSSEIFSGDLGSKCAAVYILDGPGPLHLH